MWLAVLTTAQNYRPGIKPFVKFTNLCCTLTAHVYGHTDYRVPGRAEDQDVRQKWMKHINRDGFKPNKNTVISFALTVQSVNATDCMQWV